MLILAVLSVLLSPVSSTITEVAIHQQRHSDFGGFVLVNMCILGESAMILRSYGCFCGIGGEGTPVNEVDECCRLHDECYERTVKNNICYTISTYLPFYVPSCNDGIVTCPAEGDTFYSKCKEEICKCDVAAAQCWRKAGGVPRKREYCKKNGILQI